MFKVNLLMIEVALSDTRWTPEFFGCLGYIVSCGYPTRTRGNSVAHVFVSTRVQIFVIKKFKTFFKKKGRNRIK